MCAIINAQHFGSLANKAIIFLVVLCWFHFKLRSSPRANNCNFLNSIASSRKANAVVGSFVHTRTRSNYSKHAICSVRCTRNLNGQIYLGAQRESSWLFTDQVPWVLQTAFSRTNRWKEMWTTQSAAVLRALSQSSSVYLYIIWCLAACMKREKKEKEMDAPKGEGIRSVHSHIH